MRTTNRLRPIQIILSNCQNYICVKIIQTNITNSNITNSSEYTMEKTPITPQMLRIAVKELQKFQLSVKSKNLRDYIQKYYPVETNVEALEQELQEKLKYAVCVGLLAKEEDDQYYIPNLREEANAVKTAISAFWEIYTNNNQLPNIRKKRLSAKRLTHKKRRNYVNSSKDDETDSNEDFDFL